MFNSCYFLSLDFDFPRISSLVGFFLESFFSFFKGFFYISLSQNEIALDSVMDSLIDMETDISRQSQFLFYYS